MGLLMVEVVRQVGKPFLFGVPLPGTSSFSLSPSINLFANNLNVLGLDWVGGLKNLTLSSNTLELMSPISATCIEEPPSVSMLEPFLLEQFPPCFPPESTDSGYLVSSLNQLIQDISFVFVLKVLLGGWGKPLLGLLGGGAESPILKRHKPEQERIYWKENKFQLKGKLKWCIPRRRVGDEYYVL